MGNPPGRLRLALITITLSVIVGLVAAEVVVRVFDLAPPLESPHRSMIPDPYLPFKLRPNSVDSNEVEYRKEEVIYRYNSAGFRDVEHTKEKPPGVFRILGLGDSFTEGSRADFEKTYLNRLEQMLNARPGPHPKVEIIKTGIGRYWPLPERILLEHYGVAYSPDLVTVAFVPNDVIDTLYGIDAVTVDASGFLKTREAAQLGQVGVWLYTHSHLARLVLREYVSRVLAWKHPSKFSELYRANGLHEKEWKEVEAEYGKIVQIAGRIPAKVVLIHIPQKGPWTEMHAYPGNRLGAWAAANGAGFVDILPPMIQASAESNMYLEEGHCNPDGYGLIAQTLYDYLTSNNLVP